MSDQFSFADLVWKSKGKTTRREEFLREMDRVIPWKKLTKLIAPHYPVAGNGRPPLGLEKMLRIHFLQHWFNLSDPAMEEALYDSRSMQQFAGIALGEDTVPDETTILNFRHLLEEHDLSRGIFKTVCLVISTAHRGVLVGLAAFLCLAKLVARLCRLLRLRCEGKRNKGLQAVKILLSPYYPPTNYSCRSCANP
jgi:hypothetical protein